MGQNVFYTFSLESHAEEGFKKQVITMRLQKTHWLPRFLIFSLSPVSCLERLDTREREGEEEEENEFVKDQPLVRRNFAAGAWIRRRAHFLTVAANTNLDYDRLHPWWKTRLMAESSNLSFMTYADEGESPPSSIGRFLFKPHHTADMSQNRQ